MGILFEIIHCHSCKDMSIHMGVYFKRIEQSVVSDSKIFLFFGKGRGGGVRLGFFVWVGIGLETHLKPTTY